MSLKAAPTASLPAEVMPDEASISDLTKVEEALRNGVRSCEAIPSELSKRLVLSGGKRIRPYLMCLTYRSLLNNPTTRLSTKLLPRATVEDLHALATVAEWVHTATLFHDDVLDASVSRREQASAHITHGNKVAILVGDFVYAEAFSMLMERGLLDPSRELAKTVKSLVEGELLQHQVAQSRSLKFKEFTKIARAKTGSLFAWCTSTGAWVAGSPHVDLAQDFGMNLGYAFQMADDLLDTFSLNVDEATESDLVQWSESAPSLPMVLAEEMNGGLAEAWKNLAADNRSLEERRTLVAELQARCRSSTVVDECASQVQLALDSSRGNLETLGASHGLGWALEAIGERAKRGVDAAYGKRISGE